MAPALSTVPRYGLSADILRNIEDGPVNQVTEKPWSDKHKSMLETRRKLPVYKFVQPILDMYHSNQVFVLSSETGSGKSTQVPQIIFYDEYASGREVACVQPLHQAASGLASRVAAEMEVALGSEVGYRVRDKTMYSASKARLTYLTEEKLLDSISRNIDLLEYACVILDEAHERTLTTDLLVALLKRTLFNRFDFKLIIMSATSDAGIFQEFFNGCPLLEESFDVKEHYLPAGRALSDIVELAAQEVLTIHQNAPEGDILVFAPSEDEISSICKLIQAKAGDIDIHGLSSAMLGIVQDLPVKIVGSKRKCIVSTNIAETSLTIDNIVYVVDTGLCKQMVRNFCYGYNELRVQSISQASARRRKSCAGRTRAGAVYRLYTKEDFEAMPKLATPAIAISGVHWSILKLFNAGFHRPVRFKWLLAPSPDVFSRVAQDLSDWGFLNDKQVVNFDGRFASVLPVDPIWFAAMKEANKLGCLEDMLDLAALCSSKEPIFHRPDSDTIASDMFRAAWDSSGSDHMALLNVFAAFQEECKKPAGGLVRTVREWCAAQFLDRLALEAAVSLRRRMATSLYKQYPTMTKERASASHRSNILKALARGFCTQLAIQCGDLYKTAYDGVMAKPHPNSAACHNPTEWIVYNTLSRSGPMMTMECVSPVNAEWLVDMPYFTEARMPKKSGGDVWWHPDIKESVDRARQRIAPRADN